ncbi:BTAD domain-containing putative transcriptional regulator [Plantactinospora sp. KLBMP9567]|uniref:BTAD domain-containing putative transcriptional regulator n=1 Tax=Plantactinospora sp. KLBMP9567 TaxID=3085900 RepID=UPI0039905140
MSELRAAHRPASGPVRRRRTPACELPARPRDLRPVLAGPPAQHIGPEGHPLNSRRQANPWNDQHATRLTQDVILTIQALYRSGDLAGALDAYQRARVALISGYGMEPGAELAALHRAILQGKLPRRSDRVSGGCAAAPAPSAGQARLPGSGALGRP